MSYFDRIISNYNHSKENDKKFFNSQIWSKINKVKRFDKIDISKIENFRNNGLSRGYDNDYLKSDFIDHKKNFLSFLKSSSIDFYSIKDLLPNKNIGRNPTSVLYKDTYLDSKSIDFIQKFIFIDKYIFQKKNIKSCVEIGGGYGELARIIVKKKNIKYILIDLPETNLTSSFYILNHFPNKKIVLSKDLLDNELTEKLYENNEIFILCPWDKIGKFKIDIFFNFHSFMEMNLATRKYYFNLIHDKISQDGYMLQENRYCKLVGLEKNLLREYEYDNKWEKLIYFQNSKNKKLGLILTKRTTENRKDISNLKKKIQLDSKYYEVPNLPVILILIYKFIKRLIISK